jgi:hypothetical protein
MLSQRKSSLIGNGGGLSQAQGDASHATVSLVRERAAAETASTSGARRLLSYSPERQAQRPR